MQLAEAYRLGLAHSAQQGAAGERLGKGTGASLEFQDRRHYQAGDDVRHVDWRALARSDQMFVRLYREEILPRIDVLVDVSRSMAVDATKSLRTFELGLLFAAIARASGFAVRTLALGNETKILEFENITRESLQCDGRLPLAAALASAQPLLRPGTVRIFLSDFLAPMDAAQLVRPLAARAAGIVLLQLLGQADLEPPPGAALRLTDSESDASLDLVLDAECIRGYQVRLRRLQAELETECRRCTGHFFSFSAARPLADLCRSDFSQRGLLVPA